ncbi:IS3 family transposase [Luteococcus sediminum]
MPRSTFYDRQHRGPADPSRRCRKHSLQPAALTPAEREAVIEALTRQGREGLSVQQVYWEALDGGEVVMSQASFYRIARAHSMVGDRRRGRHGQQQVRGSGRAKPVVEAGGVNQLWSWDISELPGRGRARFQLFLVLDVFSRYPVAWRVEPTADRGHAVAMFREAFATHGLPVTLHSDNGSQMRSHDMAKLLEGVVTQSFSRPHVSDDNPFSEALFKTIKYDLTMPEFFTDLDHARSWMATYLDRYARTHHHAGIGYYTPEQVFTGTAEHVHARRQAQLDAHYAQHPERYHQPPRAPELPSPTGINLSKAA